MFDKAFIEATRQAQGDEAAQLLVTANVTERLRTDPDLSSRYPTVIPYIRTGKIPEPPANALADDASLDSYLQTLEGLAVTVASSQQVVTPTEGTITPQPQGKVTPDMLDNVRPGVIPWSQAATDAVLSPINPGPGPTQSTVVVAEVEDLMVPQEGQFRRGRERDFEMIKRMEIVNRIPGGTQDLRAMRELHEDPDIFPIT